MHLFDLLLNFSVTALHTGTNTAALRFFNAVYVSLICLYFGMNHQESPVKVTCSNFTITLIKL